MTHEKEFSYIADKINKLRKELGWSQAELSRRSGVTSQAINQILSAGQIPSLMLLTKLAKAFKVNMCDLLYDSKERDMEAVDFYRQYGGILSLSNTDRKLVKGIISRLETEDRIEFLQWETEGFAWKRSNK